MKMEVLPAQMSAATAISRASRPSSENPQTGGAQTAPLEAQSACVSREEARVAQNLWAARSAGERVGFVRKLRTLIAEQGEALAAAAASVNGRPLAEKLVSEVLPLAEACRWLERKAARVLAPQRYGRRGRPLWLHGLVWETQRRPFGIVLVIGPGNYPLFLPAVHALHALAAGNAVRLKPAPGTRHVASAFSSLAVEAGLDHRLLEVLPDSTEAAVEAIAAGVDKVIFTGSSIHGRAVLAQLAETNTPAVMELSGEDAMVVLEDADLQLVARAVRFGTRLNAGETCIAPRRIIAVASIASAVRERLAETDAESLPVEIAADADAAVEVVNAAECALGASIFSRDIARARALAARIQTGFVTINDLIVPTADPRMPFGGVKASGFGTTRGAEGLLAMTFPHVVAVRRGRSHRHLDEPAADDAALFFAWLRTAHGRRRGAAFVDLLRAVLAKIGKTKAKS
jgi:acyl-CoA reductase-like NAD-dependent aldehyde dehydrogenase